MGFCTAVAISVCLSCSSLGLIDIPEAGQELQPFQGGLFGCQELYLGNQGGRPGSETENNVDWARAAWKLPQGCLETAPGPS